MKDVRDRLDQLSPLQRATLALKEMRARLDAVLHAQKEPIAIIGLACRFPGGANSPEAYWRILKDGVDATSDVPRDRWDGDAFFDPDPDAPGKMYTRRSGFLKGHDVDRFDAPFFGISPREASMMDPQQRLLLELSWEALEDAGQSPDRLAGSRTGVFVGVATADYAQIAGQGGLSALDPYIGTGNSVNTMAGRLSFVLGLHGPAVALDTACSSSLVASHLACQSLRAGESDMALVGAVNLILTPAVNVLYSRMRALAPDGRCKTFDASADGMVRGEGGAVVVLKRCRDAQRDGDRILAVIRGSAVNHDGRSSGLTVPSGTAQRAVLRAALASAGVAPAEVRFIETHGTGTPLGDPIEVNALVAEMGEGRAEDAPLTLGSAKANIGHLEACAGLAGLIKVVLALRHGEIPPQIHFQRLNPEITEGRFPLVIPTSAAPWPEGDAARIAGVSAFGVSGTNAHVILEAPPRSAPAPLGDAPGRSASPEIADSPAAAKPVPGDAWLLPISARSVDALHDLARAYHLRLADGADLRLADLCHTASLRRAHLERRLAVVGGSREELAEALSAFLQKEVHPRFFAGNVQLGRSPRIAFVFSGHSSHWAGMGRGLLEREPVFREALLACDSALAPYLVGSVVEQLAAADAEAAWERLEIVQPVAFAMQVALAALWRSWGVEPQAVVGHSMGEIAAAHVAGALSLDDAARLVCRRSEILGRVQGKGAMVVVALSAEQARAALAGLEDRVAVGVCNSRASTVLSGDPAALEELLPKLVRRNIFARKVKGATAAGHSPQMDPLLPELVRALAGLAPRAAAVPFYSTVTAAPHEPAALGPEYWARNLREPVLFAQTIQQMGIDGYDAFIEISPHPLLLGAIEQVLRPQGGESTLVPSTRSDEPERMTLRASLGRLYAAGAPLDLSRLDAPGGRFVPLPTYPWKRQRYWVSPPAPAPAQAPGVPAPSRSSASHPLLDRHIASARLAGEQYWELDLDRERRASLCAIRLQGIALVPAAIFVEMVLGAAAALLPPGGRVFEDLVLRDALLLEDDAEVTLQLILTPGPAGAASFEIWSRASRPGSEPSGGILRASGRVRAADADRDLTGDGPSLEALKASAGTTCDGAACYAQIQGRGLEVGPAMRAIEHVWRGEGEALGRLRLPDAAAADPGAHGLHPALLDAAFELLASLAHNPETPPIEGEALLPTGLERLVFHAAGPSSGAASWCHATVHPPSADAGFSGDLRLLDAEGRLLAEVRGLCLDVPDRQAARRIVGARLDGWLYELAWEAAPPAATVAPAPAPAGRWLILTDANGLGEDLARLLARRGEGALLVRPAPRFAAPPEGPWTVPPEEPEAFDRLLAEARVSGPLRGVVHLWSLDATPPAQMSVASLAADEAKGTTAVLHLVQALARSNQASPLWLVTRNAQPVPRGSEDLALAQAPLWGLGKVIALEHPELWGRAIDLDPRASSDEARGLLGAIDARDSEDFVALRGGERYVARLVRSDGPRMPAQPLALRADAAYLVTGGLGGAGLQVARWLVDRGARHLVILGRRGLPPRELWDTLAPGSDARQKVELVRSLEARGATVRALSADAGDPAAMAEALLAVRAAGLPLRGVLHAAGVTSNTSLLETDVELLRSVLHAKVAGTWILHELTRDLSLDFFVCFSSPAAVWGAARLGAYAAANHFMDIFAHYRGALGLPGQSINWGGWGGGGMITADVQRFAAQMGFGVMPPAHVLEALDAVIQGGPAQRTVARVDWRLFKAIFEARRRRTLLDRIEIPAEPSTASGEAKGAFRRRLDEAEPADRGKLLTAHVREAAASILGMADPLALDSDQGFFQMGMDSMMSVRLRNRLEISLGSSLPPTLAFEHPTVDAMTGFLAREVHAIAVQAEPLAHAPPPAGARARARVEDASLDRLSEDELEALLAAELGGAPQDAAS